MSEDETLTEDVKRAYQISRNSTGFSGDALASVVAGVLTVMAINRLTQAIQDREE
jgi:hypothetical protein